MNSILSEYCECLVKGRINIKALIAAAVSGFLAIFLLILSFVYITEPFGLVAGPMAAAFAVLALFLRKRISVEYEYVCSEAGIDIDIIYGQNKRKNVVSIPKEIISSISLQSNGTVSEHTSTPVTVKDYSGIGKAEKYVIRCSGEKLVYYVVSPNEKMLTFIRTRMKRDILTGQNK